MTLTHTRQKCMHDYLSSCREKATRGILFVSGGNVLLNNTWAAVKVML